MLSRGSRLGKRCSVRASTLKRTAQGNPSPGRASSFLSHRIEQVQKALCDLISKACTSSPIAKRFLDSIRHANEPAFQDRIESLLSRVTANHSIKLLGDLTVFAQTLKQTRNHFTHPGISTKSKVLTGAKELFLFNQRLHALLRLLMLIRLPK
jgi:Apea-like HEPN